MAKSKAAKKRKQNAQEELPRKAPKTSATTVTPPDSDDNTASNLEPKSLQTVISDEELDIAIDTLNTLAKYPNLIKSKQCRDLRVAVYDFRQNCASGVNNARLYTPISYDVAICQELTIGCFSRHKPWTCSTNHWRPHRREVR